MEVFFVIVILLILITTVAPEILVFFFGVTYMICETVLRLFGKSFEDKNKNKNGRN